MSRNVSYVSIPGPNPLVAHDSVSNPRYKGFVTTDVSKDPFESFLYTGVPVDLNLKKTYL